MTANLKKHAEVVKAYLDGAKVEYRENNLNWLEVFNPNFCSPGEYRVKKEPVIVEKYIPVGFVKMAYPVHHTNGVWSEFPDVKTVDNTDAVYSDTKLIPVVAVIRIRVDEETGEVLSAEVVKE